MIKFHKFIWDNPHAHEKVFVTTEVERGVPKLPVNIPTQCCVMKCPPYLYGSEHISGVFVRSEYGQAINSIIAYSKGGDFEGRNGKADSGEDVNMEIEGRGGVADSGEDVNIETSVRAAASFTAQTPFPPTIENPFKSTLELPKPLIHSGVIVTGSPGIGGYNRLG